MLGHLNSLRIRRAALEHHLHDLRNHIASTADHHRIADAQAQAGDFIHVVQGRIGHRDAGHLHRLKACHRGHGAGAADLELDAQQARSGSSRAGNLWAIAQRGSRARKPSSRWKAMRLTLNTTPSIS